MALCIACSTSYEERGAHLEAMELSVDRRNATQPLCSDDVPLRAPPLAFLPSLRASPVAFCCFPRRLSHKTDSLSWSLAHSSSLSLLPPGAAAHATQSSRVLTKGASQAAMRFFLPAQSSAVFLRPTSPKTCRCCRGPLCYQVWHCLRIKQEKACASRARRYAFDLLCPTKVTASPP